ncbi:MAG: shikimate kinase [Muribaculum sp.]|nr:shikimate kinase [Muribaculaceae bacterium]MCM1081563.1 shikimate kinase [Muribaculum sp.]
MMTKPIFLIGYMGSGKSTLGRTVSQLTGMPFIDLDSYIEQQQGTTVSEIFAVSGEEGFRKLEQELLRQTLTMNNTIIACGGGTPCFFDNIDLMNAGGTTVYLEAGIERLHQRLMRGRHKRPLIANMDSDQLRNFIIESLQKREPYYSKAQIRFKSDRLDNEEEKSATAQRFINDIIQGCLK